MSAELQEHGEVLAKEQAEADEAAEAFDTENEKAVAAELALKEARAALTEAQTLLRKAEATADDQQISICEQGELNFLALSSPAVCHRCSS